METAAMWESAKISRRERFTQFPLVGILSGLPDSAK